MQCTCGDVSLRNTIALFFILALCLVVHLSVVFAMTFYWQPESDFKTAEILGFKFQQCYKYNKFHNFYWSICWDGRLWLV